MDSANQKTMAKVEGENPNEEPEPADETFHRYLRIGLIGWRVQAL
jgi:hypothetical protein